MRLTFCSSVILTLICICILLLLLLHHQKEGSGKNKNNNNKTQFIIILFSISFSLRISTNSTSMEDLPSGYRPNVGVCLINDDNMVFVASRLNVPGAWQMPQGGIEEGEDPRAAAIRELREETGVVSAQMIDEVSEWLTYDFPPAVKAKVNRLWGGEWHGQAQKWFLMRFTANESEINLATGEADPEFSEWKWATPEEVVEQAVDYKRPTYEEVMKTFQPHLSTGKATKCYSTKW